MGQLASGGSPSSMRLQAELNCLAWVRAQLIEHIPAKVANVHGRHPFELAPPGSGDIINVASIAGVEGHGAAKVVDNLRVS